jgi:hypothetical protein
MLKYVRFQNSQDKIRYEQEMEQWKTHMRSKLSPEQMRKEVEDLKARNGEMIASISELKALNETLGQTIILTPQNTPRTFSPFKSCPTPRTSLLSQNSLLHRIIPHLLP